MVTHGNCSQHQFRTVMTSTRSIGKLELEVCNNCLSVVVVQRRDAGEIGEPIRTLVEMKDSAYPYVK